MVKNMFLSRSPPPNRNQIRAPPHLLLPPPPHPLPLSFTDALTEHRRPQLEPSIDMLASLAFAPPEADLFIPLSPVPPEFLLCIDPSPPRPPCFYEPRIEPQQFLSSCPLPPPLPQPPVSVKHKKPRQPITKLIYHTIIVFCTLF